MSKEVINVGQVENDGTGAWLRDGMGQVNSNFQDCYREVIRNTRSWYVSPSGDDANDGRSLGSAFKTIQRAYTNLQDTVYLARGSVANIRLAAGTYAGSMVLGAVPGNGLVQIYGDPTTPSNCVLTSTTGSVISVHRNRRLLCIQGVEIRVLAGAPNYACCLEARYGGIVSWGKVRLYCGGTLSRGIQVYGRSIGQGDGLLTFVSSGVTGNFGILVGANSFVQMSGGVTTSGTVAFDTTLAVVERSSFQDWGTAVWGGTGTGPRYIASGGSSIVTGSGSATHILGNSAGSVWLNAVYA